MINQYGMSFAWSSSVLENEQTMEGRMIQRSFVISVLWSLMPVVCAVKFLGHGFLWLALSGIRKFFQLKYKTGFASLVLLERSQLRSSLMCASFVMYRMKMGLMAIGFRRGATRKAQTPVPAHPGAE